MPESVGVRELRQNISRYLERVKEGETFVVTEHGREVARLVPSWVAPYARLAELFGATVPTERLEDIVARLPKSESPLPPGTAARILDEMRAQDRERG